MRRLRLRKNMKYELLKIVLIFIIISISFIITFKVLYEKIDYQIDNNTYIDSLVDYSFAKYNFNDLKRLSSTEFLLKYSFGIDNINTGVSVDITTPIEVEEVKNPYVYIYNTHQTEGYKSNFLETFNINNTVYIASHILNEYLNDLGVFSMVEQNSIVDVLNLNGWKYGYSYKASRILMEEAYKNNPSLNFFIDLHRDSASYDRTTTTIDNTSYAKVLFVVGKEHQNYQANLDLAKALNEIIKKKYPSLSRGVLEKEGKGVNGIYNQDFNPNTILIEVGGQYNTIEEVNNTLKVMADVLYEYLNI